MHRDFLWEAAAPRSYKARFPSTDRQSIIHEDFDSNRAPSPQDPTSSNHSRKSKNPELPRIIPVDMEQLTNLMARLGTELTSSATLFSIPYELHLAIIQKLLELSSPTDLKNLLQGSSFYCRLFRANGKGDVARKMNRLLVPVSKLVVEDAPWNLARTTTLMNHLENAEVWASWYRGWLAGGGEVWKVDGQDLLGY